MLCVTFFANSFYLNREGNIHWHARCLAGERDRYRWFMIKFHNAVKQFIGSVNASQTLELPTVRNSKQSNSRMSVN